MAFASQTPAFPPASSADRYGLVVVGGELSPEWLLEAYRQGIFPWPLVDSETPVLAWFSPDPRGILEFEDVHISQRLARRLRGKQCQVTFNEDFPGVVRGCAAPRRETDTTWITSEMIEAYQRLHDLGHAHSIEVWRAGHLVGGLYGIALGGLFAAESMFERERDASKIALVQLTRHLQDRGFALFDVQLWTPHLGRLGATRIRRSAYLRRLEQATPLEVSFL